MRFPCIAQLLAAQLLVCVSLALFVLWEDDCNVAFGLNSFMWLLRV